MLASGRVYVVFFLFQKPLTPGAAKKNNVTRIGRKTRKLRERDVSKGQR
jgi:hypothetical protein